MLFEQCTALAFGHATPYAELDAVIQGVGATFEDHRTVTTDHSGFALGGAPHEQFIGVCLAASGLRNPGNARFGVRAMGQTVSR